MLQKLHELEKYCAAIQEEFPSESTGGIKIIRFHGRAPDIRMMRMAAVTPKLIAVAKAAKSLTDTWYHDHDCLDCESHFLKALQSAVEELQNVIETP